jgi:acyl-CoA reductase-like NAD-dependent aldehyde dehydrogenase
MDRLVELEQHDLFIDGKRVAPQDGRYSTDIDPATEFPIAKVAQGGKQEVDLAVAAARRALPGWAGLRASERGRILQRAAALVEEHQEELTALESLDAGKPAELTPLSMLRVAELFLEAGVPAGVFNVVCGKGGVVGQALVEHRDIDKITFTGSPNVGRGIVQGAAGNFKKITLELGGKSANVIFADANLERAARAAAAGIFFNAGQVCSAGSRVSVERAAYDEVIDRLVEHARR